MKWIDVKITPPYVEQNIENPEGLKEKVEIITLETSKLKW